MQNAKDSFLVAMRDRLQVLNAARTVEVRGAERAAVLVAENELDGAAVSAQGTAVTGVVPENVPLLDAFVLVWSLLAVDATEPMALQRMRCEVRYATAGTKELSGLDRGRVLAAMDGELRGMLQPAVVAKRSFAGDAAVTMATNVFWGVAEFGPAVTVGDRVGRVATVDVFALTEAGEA